VCWTSDPNFSQFWILNTSYFPQEYTSKCNKWYERVDWKWTGPKGCVKWEHSDSRHQKNELLTLSITQTKENVNTQIMSQPFCFGTNGPESDTKNEGEVP
jgi:hypothetical protein